MLKWTVFAASLCLAGCSVVAPSPQVEPVSPLTVKLLALNDFHGHLESPGVFKASAAAAPVPAGGADMLAGYVAAARAAQPRTVVVSAGDLIGASPLLSALFHDEPTVEALNRVGLDFNAVGNHEFDDGVDELRRLQQGGCHPVDVSNTCLGAQVGTPVPFEGAQFQFLAANVVDTPSGRSLFPGVGIKSFPYQGQSISVAFIGLTLKETPQVVAPAGVRGWAFKDEAATVNALIPQLRASGVAAIVVLIHQGGAQAGPAPVDINGCAGQLAGSPIKAIVSQLGDAVDVVISGHTHAAYNCRLPNAAGRDILVTSANAMGRVVTDIDLTIDPQRRRVLAVAARNQVVDRSNPQITPDSGVARLVSAYKSLVAPTAGRVIGRIATDVSSTKDAACNMPAAELVADAQLAATATASPDGATLALMNPGGVRLPGFLHAQGAASGEAGQITYGDAFTVQPFGNNLVTMALTNQQLKDALEQQFPNCFGQAAHSRVLLPSAGFHYEWDATQACGAKVRQVTLKVGAVTELLVDARGVVQNPTQTHRVSVNQFLADGGDGFSVFTQGRDRVGGGQDLDALAAYLAGTLPPHAAYDPQSAALDKPRIKRVDGGTFCP